MKQHKLSLLLINLIFFGFSFVGRASATEVTSIVIEGNVRLENAAVRKLIETKEGESFDPKQIKKDIKSIYELGVLSSVRVYKEKDGDGKVKLFYVLKEKPFIRDIKFIGAKKFTSETLSDLISSKNHTVINEEKALKDRAAIEKKYKEKGFFLVNVSYKVVPSDKGESDLHFIISEGDKIVIGDITFIGNEYFSSSELLQQVFSGTKTRLNSIMSSRSNYSPEIIARDVAVLGYFYKNNGFARASVSRPTILIDKDKKYARIIIKIDEGKQYKVKEISFAGDVGGDLYSEETLREETKLKPGGIFRQSSFAADIEKLGDLYGDKGYAYAYVNPIPTYDDENALISLDYKIFKRSKIYIGEIKVVGNTNTRDNVIRRELVKINDGSLYSGSGLSQSRRNIMSLGFFEEVKISKDRSSEAEDILDIKISVKEKSTGQLRASFGATPSGEGGFGGVYGEGSYEQPNQFGRGWSLRGTGRYYNPTNYLFSLDFANPRVADTFWHSGASVSWSSQLANYGIDFSSLKNELRFNLTVGHLIVEKLNGYINYGYERRMLQEDNILVPDLIPLNSTVSSIGLRLSRKNVDNFLDPSDGTALSLRHKFIGGILGGSEKYMESLLDFKYYYPIALSDEYNIVFKWNNVANRLWNIGQPISLLSRYRLGGPSDLRGYDYESIGPVSYYKLPGNEEIKKFNRGGYLKFYTQFELIFPLFAKGMVKGVLFADAGEVLSEGERLAFRTLKYDFGFGFRWKSPIAPLRFEWAYPLDAETMEVGNPKFIFAAGV